MNEQMEQQDEEMEIETSKVDVDDFISSISGAEVDEKPSIDDSEDHIMSDISGTRYFIVFTKFNEGIIRKFLSGFQAY